MDPNYLTEATLGTFLHKFFSDNTIVHDKKIPELGFRPDYYIKEKKLLVEFDGYLHFTSNKIAVSDVKKDIIAEREGYRMIRIPYFAQLSWVNIQSLFSCTPDEVSKFHRGYNSYEDGFIDKYAATPGDFSSVGYLRYSKLMESKEFLSDNKGNSLKDRIYLSLFNRISKKKNKFFECFPSTNNEDIVQTLSLLKNCEDPKISENIILEIEKEIMLVQMLPCQVPRL